MKFSIRDLLWATVIAAMLAYYYAPHLRAVQQYDNVEHLLNKRIQWITSTYHNSVLFLLEDGTKFEIYQTQDGTVRIDDSEGNRLLETG